MSTSTPSPSRSKHASEHVNPAGASPATGRSGPAAPSESGPVTAPTPALSRRRRWAALAVLMLPVLLISVDNTVLTFAVPAISAALEPTGVQLLWMTDIYSLVLAGLLVPMGSLGDRIGRRRVLLIGATGFAAISAAAAFAPSPGWLVAARAALGVFGAMLMPATLSLIRNIFTEPGERRLAIAVWASGFSAGAALGPIVGGFLLQHFDWGSVFLMAVPVLVPLLVAAPVLVPESRDPNPGPMDLVGMFLILAGMAALVWTIKEASHGNLDAVTLALAVAAPVFLALFARRMLRRDNPMLDVRLFTNPVFTGAILSNLLATFAIVGFLFFISQHLQLVSGMPPMEAGLFLLPGMITCIVAGIVVVRFTRFARPATLVAAGNAFSLLGYLLVLTNNWVHTDVVLLIGFISINIGVGVAETISNDLIMSSVPPTKAGAASAISEAAYEVGVLLGAAILGSILTATYSARVEVPAGLAPELERAATETLGGATTVAQSLEPGAAQALLDSARTAFDSGVVFTAALAAVVMAASVVMAARTMRSARY